MDIVAIPRFLGVRGQIRRFHERCFTAFVHNLSDHVYNRGTNFYILTLPIAYKIPRNEGYVSIPLPQSFHQTEELLTIGFGRVPLERVALALMP